MRRLVFRLMVVPIALSAIVALGGLAALQQYCNDHGAIAMPHRADRKDCAARFRFEWAGWALQVLLVLVALTASATKTLRHMRGAVLTLAGVASLLAMLFADSFLALTDMTEGSLHSRAACAFVGFMLCALFDLLLVLLPKPIWADPQPPPIRPGTTKLPPNITVPRF